MTKQHGDPPKWKAVTAPAVSWLVKEELEPEAKPEPPAAANAPPVHDLPVIHGVARRDVLTSWGSGFIERRRATFTSLTSLWKELQEARSAKRRMAILAGTVTVCAVLAVGLTLAYTVRRDGTPAQPTAAAEAPANLPLAGISAGQTAGQAGQSTAEVVPASTAAGTPGVASAAAGAGAAIGEDTAGDEGEDEDESGDEELAEEEELDEEVPPQTRAAVAAPVSAGPQAFTRDEVITATRAQIGGLAECIKRARAAGELQPQRYTFMLDWTIRADGSVALPKLKGPAQVLGSSLPACFDTAMHKWRYRASPQDSPIANFPLAVTVP